MFKKLVSCALVLSALPFTGCSDAFARSRVDINVIDASTSRTLPEYRSRGDTWVEGTPGRAYTVQLVNHSSERVLVVLSVDGVNAVTGQDAGYAQSGYVLEPYETAEIDGWRKSMQQSAQFYFTSVPDSYASRTGRPDNVGVIGAAVFREKRQPMPVYAPPSAVYEESPSAAAPAPSSRADSNAQMAPQNAAKQRLGTGHGAIRNSYVSSTAFERASSRPDEVVSIRYDNRSRLAALGILPRPYRPTYAAPQPFPGFVPDPPGYR